MKALKARLAGYKAPTWGFFVGLMIVGGLIGFVLGEVWMGRGNGRYAGPIFALLGLLLAWMLWRTRPQHTEEEIAAAIAEREAQEAAARVAATARERSVRGAQVRVTRSSRSAKRKG